MAADKFLILAIVAMVLPSLTMATQYIVGDDKGWTRDYNYTEWVKDKDFRVGDTLLFNYNPQNHNVFKVNQTSFANCTVPPSNDALTTGHDVVPLDAPGKKWYICGFPEHCAQHNQKLVINVSDAWAPAPAPSAAVHTTNIIHQMYVVVVAAVALMAVF